MSAPYVSRLEFEALYDFIPFITYVVDLNTYELTYTNKALRKIKGRVTGQLCYHALYGLNKPCPHCANHLLRGKHGEYTGKTISFEFFDDNTDSWHQQHERAIKWMDDRLCKVIIDVDITQLKTTQNNLAEAHAKLALQNKKLEQMSEEAIRYRDHLEVLVAERTKEIKTAQEKLSAIFNQSSDGYILINKTLDKIECNPGILQILDMTYSEFLELFRTLSSQNAMLYTQAINRAFAYGFAQLTWNFTNKQDVIIPTEIRLHRLNLDADSCVLCIVHDLSEQKRIQEALTQAKEAAEESTKAKSDFLANMSHEIRTPMNGILGMTHLALQANPTTQQLHFLNQIQKSAQKLLQVINDILDFSKIESGKIDMEAIPFSLTETLDYLQGLFYPQAKHKKLRLSFYLDSQIPPLLLGDPLRLNQILVNFLSNAIKFTATGEVQLNIRLHKKYCNQIVLLFCIQDTGIGMDQEEAGKIFFPFTQADSSVTRKYGGTGLGLSICKQLIELMRGTVWVESDKHIGSSFYFTASFPLAHNLPQEADTIETMASVLYNCRILLVEDNEINQEIATTMLETFGAKITIAPDGQVAVDLAKQNEYDLILMDIQMPILDGFQATQQIRQFDQNTPIIAMTANAMQGDREKSLNVGMNDHVTKPIDPVVLHKTVLHWYQNNL